MSVQYLARRLGIHVSTVYRRYGDLASRGFSAEYRTLLGVETGDRRVTLSRACVEAFVASLAQAPPGELGFSASPRALRIRRLPIAYVPVERSRLPTRQAPRVSATEQAELDL